MSKRKNRQSYIPTSREKHDAPEMFRYEFNMFWRTLDIHINLTGRYSASQEIMHNVTLESLLVHTRNLYDFFHGPATEKDDMRAFHFIEGHTLWHPSKSEYLEEIRPNINKYLSHLTYSRIPKKAIWDWRKIAVEIKEAYKEFLEALSGEEVDQWKIDSVLH